MPSIWNSARAVIIRDQSILLVECLIHGETRYFLPGGGQESGEPLNETARREVLEETGHTVTVGELMWVREYIPMNHTNQDGAHRVDFIFRCALSDCTSVSMPNNADRAQIGIRWVPLDELHAIQMWPERVRDLLTDQITGLGDSQTYLGDCA